MADREQSMIPEQEARDALAPNYILEKELGRGGMGAVYLARDVRLDRPVAIKFLPPDMAAREDLRARFLQETRLASSQAEATRGTVGVATDTLDRVMTELSDAKLATTHKREQITTALERLRLELIRLRSGVGTTAEVRAEAERAKSLVAA